MPIAVGVGVGNVAQIPLMTVLLSSVTAPVCANSWPFIYAPVVAVMESYAKMCPTKVEFVPKVAELPTFQNTRQCRALLMIDTTLSEAVVSVVSIRKMNTPLGSPCASSVSVPVIPKVPLAAW